VTHSPCPQQSQVSSPPPHSLMSDPSRPSTWPSEQLPPPPLLHLPLPLAPAPLRPLVDFDLGLAAGPADQRGLLAVPPGGRLVGRQYQGRRALQGRGLQVQHQPQKEKVGYRNGITECDCQQDLT
jgi:hypothetical protein